MCLRVDFSLKLMNLEEKEVTSHSSMFLLEMDGN